jgi:hypothetical protein
MRVTEVERIAHRELRNNSSSSLRRAAAVGVSTVAPS